MSTHPLVVIGAGPIGLAAAANAAERDLDVIVLEAGTRAGASVAEWGHVRLFSPWSELIDPAARRLLEESDWVAPDSTTCPTGGEWQQRYLQPLADLLGVVRYDARVTGVARRGRDLVVDSGRTDDPFVVHIETPDGEEERILGASVIDASGTWTSPNPLGADGYAATGERAGSAHISYGIPDFADPAVRARYSGKHVAVAGKGASAQAVLVGLAEITPVDGVGRVTWLVRRPSAGDAFGGGDNDQLARRGALGQRARVAASASHVSTVTSFRTESVVAQGDGRLTLRADDGHEVSGVDEVVVVTGFRPDLSFLTEVRLDLDPALSAPRVLAGQIHPDHHSCGDVAPHGFRELAQPEEGLYLVGMKSYGRAPSFLAMTGFEQVRSVVAALDGDLEAAARVELVLPETGVCNGAGAFDERVPPSAGTEGGCCGAPGDGQLVTLAPLAGS